MRRDTDGPGGWETGKAGASARAEYERRTARDDARRRARYGPLAPVVRALSGPRATTEVWGQGAVGEELVGPAVERAVGARGIVLHDRRVRGSRGNLDHIAIVPSGVWVIDTKHRHGRLARRRVGGWFTHREVLMVGRRDETRCITSSKRQWIAVEKAAAVAGAAVPVRATVCFTGVELPLFARPWVMDGVLVTWPRALARTLRNGGSLDRGRRAEVAALLSHAFPPYQR